jgi:uncharacterized cupin superfamily protein
MESREHGLEPATDGWFILNAADAVGWSRKEGATHVFFESDDSEFPHFGIGIAQLAADVPNCLYHREDRQEGFLVLEGEPLLLIEGEERRLKQWDYVHCPPDAEHVVVGPGTVLMIGDRSPDEKVHYPVSELAGKYGASAVEPSDDPKEAYPAAGWSRDWKPVKMPWPG